MRKESTSSACESQELSRDDETVHTNSDKNKSGAPTVNT